MSKATPDHNGSDKQSWVVLANSKGEVFVVKYDEWLMGQLMSVVAPVSSEDAKSKYFFSSQLAKDELSPLIHGRSFTMNCKLDVTLKGDVSEYLSSAEAGYQSQLIIQRSFTIFV